MQHTSAQAASSISPDSVQGDQGFAVRSGPVVDPGILPRRL